MGRKARFDRRDMTRAALRLVAERGPQAVTIGDVAAAVGAPIGSIYHRYRGRDELLAGLWMEVVEAYQREFVATLEAAGDLDGAVTAAGFMPRWARAHPLESRLLLLHRRQDFVSGDWPAELATRSAALEPQIGQALRGLCARTGTLPAVEALARLRYGLLDAPFGAIKPYVQAGKPIPRIVDQLVGETARAVLAPILAPVRAGRRP